MSNQKDVIIQVDEETFLIDRAYLEQLLETITRMHRITTNILQRHPEALQHPMAQHLQTQTLQGSSGANQTTSVSAPSSVPPVGTPSAPSDHPSTHTTASPPSTNSFSGSASNHHATDHASTGSYSSAALPFFTFVPSPLISQQQSSTNSSSAAQVAYTTMGSTSSSFTVVASQPLQTGPTFTLPFNVQAIPHQTSTSSTPSFLTEKRKPGRPKKKKRLDGGESMPSTAPSVATDSSPSRTAPTTPSSIANIVDMGPSVPPILPMPKPNPHAMLLPTKFGQWSQSTSQAPANAAPVSLPPIPTQVPVLKCSKCQTSISLQWLQQPNGTIVCYNCGQT